MEDNSALIDLFNRWERVWHKGEYELITASVEEKYIRHDEKGDRTITREAYAKEIAQTRQERPDIHFVVYDHSFAGNRAWFRFTLKWTDLKTGMLQTRAGMQLYRIEGGKLAETWLVFQEPGSAWPDVFAQENWTSPSPLN